MAQSTRGRESGATNSTLGTAKEDIATAMGAVQKDAAGIASEAKEELLHRADAVKEEARAKIEEGKSVAAEGLEAFASAIRKAGDELRGQNQTTTARLVGEAANGLESFSRALNEKSLDGIIDSARSFARSNPAAFVAGSVLAGVALGRFVRSSSNHSSGQARGYGTDNNAGSTWNGESNGAGEESSSSADTSSWDRSTMSTDDENSRSSDFGSGREATP